MSFKFTYYSDQEVINLITSSLPIFMEAFAPLSGNMRLDSCVYPVMSAQIETNCGSTMSAGHNACRHLRLFSEVSSTLRLL